MKFSKSKTAYLISQYALLLNDLFEDLGLKSWNGKDNKVRYL